MNKLSYIAIRTYHFLVWHFLFILNWWFLYNFLQKSTDPLNIPGQRRYVYAVGVCHSVDYVVLYMFMELFWMND